MRGVCVCARVGVCMCTGGMYPLRMRESKVIQRVLDNLVTPTIYVTSCHLDNLVTPLKKNVMPVCILQQPWKCSCLIILFLLQLEIAGCCIYGCCILSHHCIVLMNFSCV